MQINLIDKEKEPLTLKETLELWEKIKARYPDALVLLRKENAYYTFEPDAEIVTTVMKIHQPSLHQNKYGCTVALYELERFLCKLSRAGYRLAVCEPQFFKLYQ